MSGDHEEHISDEAICDVSQNTDLAKDVNLAFDMLRALVQIYPDINDIEDAIDEAERRVGAVVREAQTAAVEWREKLASVTAQRDEYKALARIGTWHNECRPNRHQAAEAIQVRDAEIDRLVGVIAQLRKEAEELRAKCEFQEQALHASVALALEPGRLHCGVCHQFHTDDIKALIAHVEAHQETEQGAP